MKGPELEGLRDAVRADTQGRHEEPSLNRFADQNSLPYSTSLRTLAYLSTGGVVSRPKETALQSRTHSLGFLEQTRKMRSIQNYSSIL